MTWAGFVRTAYQAARSWGIQPSEFWAMSPAEWWVELDAKLIESRAIRGATGKGGKGFSAAEWAEARAKHKAKING